MGNGINPARREGQLPKKLVIAAMIGISTVDAVGMSDIVLTAASPVGGHGHAVVVKIPTASVLSGRSETGMQVVGSASYVVDGGVQCSAPVTVNVSVAYDENLEGSYSVRVSGVVDFFSANYPVYAYPADFDGDPTDADRAASAILATVGATIGAAAFNGGDVVNPGLQTSNELLVFMLSEDFAENELQTTLLDLQGANADLQAAAAEKLALQGNLASLESDRAALEAAYRASRVVMGFLSRLAVY